VKKNAVKRGETPAALARLHFGDSVAEALPGKRGLVTRDVDGRLPRLFFNLAGIESVTPRVLLDVIETAGQRRRSTQWWYECYAHLAESRQFYGQGHQTFAGRRILLAGRNVIAVPDSSDVIVALPPAGATDERRLPRLFESSFVMLSARLAELLRSGPDTVQAWVLNRFRIARFEASDSDPALKAHTVATGNSEAGQVGAWFHSSGCRCAGSPHRDACVRRPCSPRATKGLAWPPPPPAECVARKAR
jgi:hypothetical protein